MEQYKIGSDAKTVRMALDLIGRIQSAINAEQFAEAERLISIGTNAANRPFRAEFLARA